MGLTLIQSRIHNLINSESVLITFDYSLSIRTQSLYLLDMPDSINPKELLAKYDLSEPIIFAECRPYLENLCDQLDHTEGGVGTCTIDIRESELELYVNGVNFLEKQCSYKTTLEAFLREYHLGFDISLLKESSKYFEFCTCYSLWTVYLQEHANMRVSHISEERYRYLFSCLSVVITEGVHNTVGLKYNKTNEIVDDSTGYGLSLNDELTLAILWKEHTDEVIEDLIIMNDEIN